MMDAFVDGSLLKFRLEPGLTETYLVAMTFSVLPPPLLFPLLLFNYCALTEPVFPLTLTLAHPLDSLRTSTFVPFASFPMMDAFVDGALLKFRLEPGLTETYLVA